MLKKKANKEEDFSFKPFENLKEIVNRSSIPLISDQMSSKKREEKSIDDMQFFLDSMRSVKEIKEFRDIPFSTKSIKPVMKKSDEKREVMNELRQISYGGRAIDLRNTQEYVEWLSPGYCRDLLTELHEGRYSVQEFVDLHGYTIDEARELIDIFMNRALQGGKRCVKIIHGRGLRSLNGPVLKNEVISRLCGHYRKKIIAFTSARQCDGGLGAVYVLLKK